ncbi:VCBS repeat-containing protein [Adhaeribacter rhizoryzae]|uniref:VCBS repeat-containing protein n=1 Tax=Adhaeribacter rhizoryzae TaxID=2607907 RepID=A0A5M6D5K4_9BACT|nr:VCBS repeat-containing protein [Adhaeribacter rhizoryzae]KAA5541592.1 VCBS repeat-containing protein [Adhaeribacter rhizoryzae]
MSKYKYLVTKSNILFYFSGLLLILVGLASACSGKKATNAAEKPLFVLTDSTQTNINFVNKLKPTEKLNILDYLYFYNGAGVAAGDVNNDGLVDLFFVSNQGKNKLYLNKGQMQFQDISEIAGVQGFADWKTGVTMADVNGDGLLDIYVCAVGNFRGLEGSNELYINNGLGPDGNISFTEKAADYGLDFTGFATQAAFFDYDRDGDLDVYLLNHAVHTSRSYDRVSTRHLQNNEAGDYLLENQMITAKGQAPKGTVVKFKDVSKQAKIYQAAMGYGLGIAISDLNNDGWDDIYVSNDFHEDDYYYLNNGNGTFTESVKEHFRHLSRFSMGNDAADMNNDGYPDIMTLDMYPEDETIEKASLGEDPFDIYQYKLAYGYFNQYSRNCLQLNVGGQKFSDIGLMAGVAATDWSWAPLLADYDNDGIKDIFISNGIAHRPNNLDYVKFAADDSLRYAMETSNHLDNKAIGMMPEGKVHNYLYRGTSNLKFQDKSEAWGFKEANISNGAAYADLDNDGDLDLITNNINEAAGIYRNNSNQLTKNNYLKIKLVGDNLNKFGLGAKVYLKSKGQLQTQQLHPTRGFLSSVEPTLTFGLGKLTSVDTLIVIWGNQKAEVKANVKVNSTLILKQVDAQAEGQTFYAQLFPKTQPLFTEATQTFAVNYKHAENNYLDYYRESLMPFQVSTEGPKLAVGDVNNDGLEDFYVGGAKWQAGALFVQSTNGKFTSTNQSLFQTDSTYEDVDAVFFDADNDKDLDLYVVSGGNEFYDKMPELFDRLYLNDGKGNFSRSQNLPAMYDNKSCVRPADFDKDGDLDLFVGGRVLGYQYGMSPKSYLLLNDGQGRFTDATAKIAPALQKAGMVTDGQWADYDQDGDLDLVVVGDWMPVQVYENQKGKFILNNATGLAAATGFWQVIKTADFDKDGDLDFVVGNLGTNTKLRKQEKGALKLYLKDIDGNQTLDHLLAYQIDQNWYPVASKDELGKQMPLVNKKFTNYRDFAGKTIDQIFDKDQLAAAKVLEVNTFESVYLENLGNKKFKLYALPREAQVSKIFALHLTDMNNDGNLDILMGGNFYGVSPYQGRYDASYGLLLQGNGHGKFKAILPTQGGLVLEGQVRDIKPLQTSNGELLLVARNDLPLQIFRRTKNPRENLVVKTKSEEIKKAQL